MLFLPEIHSQGDSGKPGWPAARSSKKDLVPDLQEVSEHGQS